MPLVVVNLRSLAISVAAPGLAIRHDAPDLALAAAPVRIARIERAVARKRHVVRLVEFIGAEIGAAPASPDEEQKDRCALVVRHDTCAGRGRTGSTRRCCPAGARRTGSERVAPAATLPIVPGADVHHVKIARRIDRGPLDAEGVFAGRRELPALEQGPRARPAAATSTAARVTSANRKVMGPLIGSARRKLRSDEMVERHQQRLVARFVRDQFARRRPA